MTHATVQRWGNSLGIRIPKDVALSTNMSEGTRLVMSVEDGDIVLRVALPRYDLNELLEQATPENRHEETDFGGPQGKEIL